MTFEDLAAWILEADTQQEAIAYYGRGLQELPPPSGLWSIPDAALQTRWPDHWEQMQAQAWSRYGGRKGRKVRKNCDATYWYQNQEMRCQRPHRAFPHFLHEWKRRLSGGGVMAVEWKTEMKTPAAGRAP